MVRGSAISRSMTKNEAIQVKICGLKTPEMVAAAASAGADYVGFAHIEKSPRNIEPEAAATLANALPKSVQSVALLLDPSDEAVKAASYADWIQLHGKETPDRCRKIGTLSGRPILKALALASAQDLEASALYGDAVQMLLFDAKPADAQLPGGNGIAFDWRLLQNATPVLPWMLSGGLTTENVAQAIELTGAIQVDVSSGIEISRGEKSAARIEAFIRAAKEKNK
jgi:phosphoribosylanthranilate isomerase